MKKVLFLMVSVLILGLVFAGCSDIAKISSPATGNTDDVIYKCECFGPETATGMGSRIIEKKNGGGTWFMYNKFVLGADGDGDYGYWNDDIYVYKIQAGNPKNGLTTIGAYWIYPLPLEEGLGPDWYRMKYDINTDSNGNPVFDVIEEHLAIQNDWHDFTAKPGKDDNQDFGVPFYDDDGEFYIFAHFAVDCAD